MTKSQSISVTEVFCSCGFLARSSVDPNLPVKFYAELNEYHFEHVLPMGSTASVILYHCPMCGGVAANSQRHKRFATLAEAEVWRLESLMRGVRTVEDIAKSLGAPDSEETLTLPPDVVVTNPQTGEREHGPLRVLNYTRLSEAADVQFTVYSNQRIEGVIAAKQTQPTI